MIRCLLAYAVAVQAILTVWGGAVTPANAGDDVFSVICRSVSVAQGQDQSDPVQRTGDHGLACHCTAACAAGGGCCGAGGAGVVVVLPVPEGRAIAFVPPQADSVLSGALLASQQWARAPPVVI